MDEFPKAERHVEAPISEDIVFVMEGGPIYAVCYYRCRICYAAGPSFRASLLWVGERPVYASVGDSNTDAEHRRDMVAHVLEDH